MKRCSSSGVVGGMGFTLIELLAVLGIIVLFAAVGVVTWRPIPSAGLQVSAQLVAELLADARALAVATQSPVRLVATPESVSAGAPLVHWTRWRIYRSQSSDRGGWAAVGPEHRLLERTVIAIESSRLLTATGAELGIGSPMTASDGTVRYVEFAPDGTSQPRSETGDGMIALETEEAPSAGARRLIRWRQNGSISIEEVTDS